MDIPRKVTRTMPCRNGHSNRVTVRMILDAAQRYEVIVQGRCVGWGFPTADDGLDRASEYLRSPADSALGGCC